MESLFNIYVPVNYRENKQCWDSVGEMSHEVQLENVILDGDLNLTLNLNEKRVGSRVRDSAREWV